MGDGGWLRDEPATWHEVNRALQDVAILLQYIGELPDARLLGYFKNTQAQLVDSGARRSIPPCNDYAVFLDRLNQIAKAFQTGQANQLPAEKGMRDKEGDCSAVAFVYWSRDFLSAVAAPATADSIRLTRDYLDYRAWWSRIFRAYPPRPPGADAVPALPPDLSAPTRDRLARRLAFRVLCYEVSTLFVALPITILLSIYVLSGRLILNNEHEIQDVWSSIDKQVEAEESKVFQAPTLPVGLEARSSFQMSGLCKLKRELPPDPSNSQIAANGSPPYAAGSSGEDEAAYATPRQAHLCDEQAKAILNLFATTAHLQSWSSVVTDTMVVGVPFGVSHSALRAFATTSKDCFGLRRDSRDKGEDTLGECEQIITDEIDRSRHVGESVLGALTQYVLPIFYGFLGSMAATLRLLRRKVDGFTLRYTDRARFQQGTILGVLCGAVIGLFATYLSGTNTAGDVGISAIALLAGYNVDGVFRFLDELSDRLFRPATGKPG